MDRLLPGDTILVPPVGPQVSVAGMVRRQAIYELKEQADLKDVLNLAGGGSGVEDGVFVREIRGVGFFKDDPVEIASHLPGFGDHFVGEIGCQDSVGAAKDCLGKLAGSASEFEDAPQAGFFPKLAKDEVDYFSAGDISLELLVIFDMRAPESLFLFHEGDFMPIGGQSHDAKGACHFSKTKSWQAPLAVLVLLFFLCYPIRGNIL